ncbi:MAG: hypothetical protein ABR577_15295 [Pyrinomonadaceae bacterium]
MNSSFTKRTRRDLQHFFAAVLIAALTVCIAACAGATRPPDAAGPRANEPPYPVLLVANEDRTTASLAAWSALTKAQNIPDAPAPEFDPVTGAIRSLPVLPNGAALYLPKIGAQPPMTEEETRESLRRFIVNESRLIGAEPQQLSLVARTETPANIKTARYEQRPFRYALRGGFGMLQIDFAPDGRLLQLSSTCIPEAESLQRSGTGVRPRYTAEEVIKRLVGRSFALTGNTTEAKTSANVNTNQNTAVAPEVTILAGDQISIRELVVYPRRRLADPAVIEFHLAWEIALAHGTQNYTVYLDAVTDEFLGATPGV